MKRICILGAGSWGTAIATLLAENGYEVSLWCYEVEVANSIKETRENKRYLPGITLDKKIIPITDLQEAICGAQWIFEAIPIKYLRAILEQAKDCFSPEQTWVVLSKGMEQGSLLLPTQILDDVFGGVPQKAVFAGPSFAIDVAKKQITAVTVAATDCEIGLNLQKLLANRYFRPYVSLDMIGAQIGGALKNVLTLGVGMLDGAGYTDNAKAFLLTRGLHEMVLLAKVLGGRQETLYGLSGVGDLVLTSMGKLSRNLAVGKKLGQGQNLDAILKETGFVPEGINTVKSVYQLIQQKNLDLPICQGIYQVIYERKQLQDVLAHLMARPLEQECK